jgi:hypothetical protein
MRLRRAASLWIAAVTSATWALADVKAVRTSPSFTPQEIELIGKDERLIGVAKQCAWQLRQALDALPELNSSSRVGVMLEPCLPSAGRASDEGALDILKILRDASDQGAGRSTGADHVGTVSERILPVFTGEELVLIYKSPKLKHAVLNCAWQLRHALDSQHYGVRDWPPQRPCWLPSGSRSGDEGALDIMKILRDAAGGGKN